MTLELIIIYVLPTSEENNTIQFPTRGKNSYPEIYSPGKSREIP